MIIEKLMNYKYNKNRGLDREGQRLVMTCQADLVYYAVLRAAYKQFGTPGPGKDIRNIHADVLGAARDQMARRASLDGLLRFADDGLVDGFQTEGATAQERLASLARASFYNCEGIRSMVATYVSGLDEYKGSEMSEEERKAAVEKLMGEAMEPDSAFMADVGAAISGMSHVMDGTADDLYAFWRPEEARSLGNGRRIDKRAGAGRVPVLKLSPLMPEFRRLRMIPGPKSEEGWYAPGPGAELGLHRDQSSAVKRQLGDARHQADPEVGNNALLLYDFERGGLHKFLGEYWTRNGRKDFQPGMFLQVPTDGIVPGRNGRPRAETYSSRRTLFGGEDGTERLYDYDDTVPLFDLNSIPRGMNKAYAWRMADILRTYSEQELTDEDLDIVRSMFQHGSPTLFGDPVSDPEGTARNADAYFGYIEHVCRTVRDRMPSHEFGIHLSTQNYFKSQDEKADAFVPLLWFTGERTDDYRRARSNPSRYFAVYPYMDYVPANLDSTPLVGDIAPATYNSYTVTRGSHRRGNDDVNTPSKNPYARVRRLDQALVSDMREIFDAYMGLPGADRAGLEIAKVRRPVGDTGLGDLADFVNPDGSVNGQAIIDALSDDMDAVKDYQLTAVAQPVMRDRMQAVLDRFVSKGGADPSSVSIGGAVASFLERRYGPSRNSQGRDRHGFHADPRSMDNDTKALARALERCARQELQDSYGKDMESMLVSKHVFNAFLGQFARLCVGEFHEQRDALISNAGTSRGISEDAGLVRSLDEEAQDMLAGFRQEGRYGILPADCMEELFGRRGEDGKVVIRANACRSLSRHFMFDDYNNLLSMLSYSGAAGYEPSCSKSLDDVLGGMSGQRTRCTVQRYSPDAYDITDGILEDPDADEEERAEVRGSILEEKRWFEAVFAGVDSDPEAFDRTLSWIERDFSRDPYDGQMIGEPDWLDPNDPVAHAVYVAKHPLQVEAMREAGRRLSEIEGDGFDPGRLAITPQGMLYYKNTEGDVLFKAGPVIDEAGYIHPQTWITEDDNDELADEVRECVVLDRAEDGSVKYDEKGVALTKKAKVAAQFAIAVNPDGTLANPVSFGALDLRSAALPGSDEKVPLNRYYRLSAKILPYDGYDYAGQRFDERLSVYSYKNGVMEGLGRSLELYRIAKGASRGESGALTARGRLSMSVFYTNAGSNSLRKCYQTNTYVIEENPKCVIGDAFLSAQVEDMGMMALYEGGHEEEAERVADLLMAQAHQAHSTLVFPKIVTGQDIGLYNQAVNIQQGLATSIEGGNLDRENLRNCDCLSQRVAFAQPGRMLDPSLTGSAKNIGAAAILTDAADFDWRTRTVTVQEPGEGDLSGTNNRCRFTSAGVIGFNFNNVAVQFVEYADGQALDRLQLSINAAAKAVNYAKDVRFAMANYGYNMEDGYIIAERSAGKFGHFSEDGTYHEAELWDKIGDSESGNKGVIAKIVPTSIGEGMADAQADDEFLARFTYGFLQTHGFNHGRLSDNMLAGPVAEAEREFLDADGIRRGYLSVGDWMSTLVCEDGWTVAQHYDSLKQYMVPDGAGSYTPDREARIQTHKNMIYGGVRDACLELGQYLMDAGAEPFTGNYKLEQNLWQLFRDNPDLDVAVTNVCVCTRSNPSLLMHISENLDADREAMGEGSLSDNEPGMSGLVVRGADGEKSVLRGAVGTFNVYVDSHTADSKNIDYMGDASKPGRTLGAQETYAMQAKKAAEGFLSFLMANDSTRPKDVSKLAGKLMMSGYALAMPKTRKENEPPFQVVGLSDALDHTELERRGVTPVLAPSDPDSPLYPFGFVDMRSLAESIATEGFQKAMATGNKHTTDAIQALGDLDFSVLLSPADNGAGAKSCDDMIHRMFEASVGRYGGSFILLPDNVSHVLRSGPEGGDSRSTGLYVSGTVDVPGEGKREAAPLFISAKEIENMDSELVASHIDDRLQFKAFKAALAGAVIEHLSEAKAGSADFLDKDVAKASEEKISDALVKAYADMPGQKSMSLENMNTWLKKNIYKVTNPVSLTCVWAGDPTLELDEAGLSFEKAKSLGFLKPRKDLSQEQLEEIPDTYEYMAQRYEPVTDDDLVIINRSPGQTTGCIRAFRLRITGPDGDGLKIHPAAATIFDGDFDGDTVGVANVQTAIAMGWMDEGFEGLKASMQHEMRSRLTMAGNLLQKASYTSVSYTGRNGEAVCREDVHPLFIADNADFARAAQNMARPVASPDGKSVGPACGYDLKSESERCMVMANLLEQVRQCHYDDQNARNGLISRAGADKIIAARESQVADLRQYFDDMPKPAGDGWEAGNAAYWAETVERFDAIKDVRPVDLDAIEKLEASVCRRVKGFYREMCGYLSDPPMIVHGESHHEMLQSVMDGANAGRKGKLPQLNALLKFSGTHAECQNGPGLRVVKGDKGFVLEYGQAGPDGAFQKLDLDGYDEAIKFDNIRNMSDISATDFRTKEIANLVAQGDKSDATGLGGTLAQRLQMIMAPAGYGELALRISGPITQRYLDAKQNVLACETNLTIGKSILNPVYHFKRVDQLQDSYIKKNGHAFEQVYKGQFTVSSRPMTLSEGISQMDNFLQVMGHPALSEIDRAQFEAAMERFVDEKGYLKDPLKDYNGLENVTYTAMYGGAGRMPGLLKRMSDEGLGLFSGAPYESSAWACAEKAAQALAATREAQAEAAGYEGTMEGLVQSIGKLGEIAEKHEGKPKEAVKEAAPEYQNLAGGSWLDAGAPETENQYGGLSGGSWLEAGAPGETYQEMCGTLAARDRESGPGPDLESESGDGYPK